MHKTNKRALEFTKNDGRCQGEERGGDRRREGLLHRWIKCGGHIFFDVLFVHSQSLSEREREGVIT